MILLTLIKIIKSLLFTDMTETVAGAGAMCCASVTVLQEHGQTEAQSYTVTGVSPFKRLWLDSLQVCDVRNVIAVGTSAHLLFVD